MPTRIEVKNGFEWLRNKYKNVVEYMHNRLHIFIVDLVITILATGCIEREELQYDQMRIEGTGSATLDVQPVTGQGYKLTAVVHNLYGTIGEMGFHINLFHDPQCSEEIATWNVPVQDINDFSAIVTTQLYYARYVEVYAYVRCDDIKVQSQKIRLELTHEVLPDPMPVMDSIRVLPQLDFYGYAAPSDVIVYGHGFVPFKQYWYDDPERMYKYIYLEYNGSPIELKSATEDRLYLKLDWRSYNNYTTFVYHQGNQELRVDSLCVEAPNWIEQPTRPYRYGEMFVPEYHYPEADKGDIQLYAVYTLDVPFRLEPKYMNDACLFHQRYGKVSIKGGDIRFSISSPWRAVEDRKWPYREMRDRTASGHITWYHDDEGLCWFDGRTQSLYTDAQAPFAWGDNTSIATCEHDDYVLVSVTSRRRDSHQLYRFTPSLPEGERYELLGNITPHSNYSIRGSYVRDNMLCVVYSQLNGQEWMMTYTDLDTLEEWDIQQIKMPERAGSDIRFGGEYDGRLYFLTGGAIYEYTILFNSTKLIADLSDCIRIGPLLSVSGHWLYCGDTPLIRIDLDSQDRRLEYLGCPGKHYDDVVALPAGEDCFVGVLETKLIEADVDDEGFSFNDDYVYSTELQLYQFEDDGVQMPIRSR